MDNHQLDLWAVRRSGINWWRFRRIIKQASSKSEGNTLVLFPEDTFSYKYKPCQVETELKKLSLDERTTLFFSVFEIDPEKESKIHTRESLDKYDEELTAIYNEKLREQGLVGEDIYSNFGYVVFLTNGRVEWKKYRKFNTTQFDTINSRRPVKVRYCQRTNIKLIATTFTTENSVISPPQISVGGKTIEYKVCIDIINPSKLDSDLILCSAHGLNPENRQVKGKLVLINDSERGILGYHDGKLVYGFQQCKELLNPNNINFHFYKTIF